VGRCSLSCHHLVVGSGFSQPTTCAITVSQEVVKEDATFPPNSDQKTKNSLSPQTKTSWEDQAKEQVILEHPQHPWPRQSKTEESVHHLSVNVMYHEDMYLVP
jgi:hypothetical protein